ncbi:MAG: UvrD-helicase domain-containing protein [Patescibacteria group bacterium]
MSNLNALNHLNKAQKEAVLHQTGPLLIIAGAGSGKTKVLTHRIAHLISRGCAPNRILAVTFTNKAAGEMRERIFKLLQADSYQPSSRTRAEGLKDVMPWIGTFHSLGAAILRQEYKAAGLAKHFTILDEEDSLALVKEAIKELILDPKQFQPSKIKNIISRQKGDLIKIDDLENEADNYFLKILAQIRRIYEEKLRTAQSLDFDDLLVKTAALFEKRPDILAKYQEQWQFINIDEYQDTDSVQYRLANMLAAKHSNICVVGDMDQSIYSFRGADFRNILKFESDWPGAKIITLEENYRSLRPILDAANAVIAKNKLRKPKNLFTRQTGGEKLELFVAGSEDEEAEFIADKTKNLIESGHKPNETAVLFRANFQSRVLEEKFLAYEIPYYVVGVKFYARKEIKDILAYLRSALNSGDLISKKRIINVPSREIGKVLTARYFSGSKLSDAEQKKIRNFETVLAEIKTGATRLPASKAVASAIQKSGYLDIFDPKIEEDLMRIANIKELAALARRFDGLKAPEGLLKILEEAALMSESDAPDLKKRGVPLTTVHAAKGLEFDNVFIAGLEDGLFPHSAIGGDAEKTRIEEERRLFYVALTRARKKVFLSLALLRTIFGEKQANMPSRFLQDIPFELINSAGKEKIIEL